jgi:hypothetical protein
MTICLYKALTRETHGQYGAARATCGPISISKLRASESRVRDVRAADLQEDLAEQRFSVPPDPTKTAATQRTSQRAERAVKQSAMREQLERKESHE